MVEGPNVAPSPLAAENENDSELLDRLRSTALGSSRDAKSRRSAQLAFDPDVDLEKRMRHIAGLTDVDTPKRTERGSKKGTLGWLPIPLGILAVISLGAAMTRSRPSPPPKMPAVGRDSNQAQSPPIASGVPAPSAPEESKRTNPSSPHGASTRPSPSPNKSPGSQPH